MGNSESVYHKACLNALSSEGIELTVPFDYQAYTLAAHFKFALNDGLKQISKHHSADHPVWNSFDSVRLRHFHELARSGVGFPLMSGVDRLLSVLSARQIPHCVCTNATDDLVDAVKYVKGNESLLSIPLWLTRGSYAKPKPSPECYILGANPLFSSPLRMTHLLGFDDTPKGLLALIDARKYFQANPSLNINLIPVFITQWEYPELDEWIRKTGISSFKHPQSGETIQPFYLKAKSFDDITKETISNLMK